MAMERVRNERRVLALAASAFLFAAACSSGEADVTTSSSTSSTSSSTTSSSTTTTTEALTANGPAIMTEGERNETVEAFQFLANCSGYAQLTVDGAFGPATLTAVETVQTELGREVTGAPDDETFALLSRSCSDDRRVTIDEEDEGEQVVVGNVADGDPESFFIRADEGERMSVVVNDGRGAVVNVRSAAGGAVGTGGSAAWAADIDSTGDFVVEISSVAPVTYVATFALATLDPDEVDAADEGTVLIDDLDNTVSATCLDTGGDGSYVAETALGHLIVSTDRPGDFAVTRGGVGAAVEFVFSDGSPGYYGFSMDLEVEVGDQIEGTGIVFLQGDGNSDEPLGVAFNFERSVIPCEGTEGTSVVLTANGLGIIDFGAEPDETIDTVRAALVGASPSVDSDWVTIDNLSNEFGVCRQGTTAVRSVAIDNLTLYFTNGGTSFADEGTRHFAAFVADDGVFPLKTVGGVGPGDTLEQVLAAHTDSSAAAGLTGGVDAYVSSPPGSDRWLRATAEDASGVTDTTAAVTSVSGGRFCDL